MRASGCLWAAKGLVFTLLLSAPAWAGSIQGKVTVRGLRSPENILIYLDKAPRPEMDLASVRLVIDQRNLSFIPHVLPVVVGSVVHFPNNDKVDHNVFSVSKAKKFNLGSYKPGESRSVVFDKPGIVELRCDVHAEMQGYIFVLRNPYWALTDSQGRFSLPDNAFWQEREASGVAELPAGNYRLKTWHEKLRSVSRRISVPSNGKLAVDLVLSRGTPGVLYKR